MPWAKDDTKARACIEAVIAVLAEHGFTLAHEDSHGAFILQVRDNPRNVQVNEQWIRDSFLDRKVG
jgi:hypothetical protein